jgi:chromosome partitioning protein
VTVNWAGAGAGAAAGAVAAAGRRVLLGDADPHGGAGAALGVAGHQPNLVDVLRTATVAAAAITNTNTPGVDLLPTDVTLSELEAELPRMPAWQGVLRRALEPVVAGYDAILLDGVPGLGPLGFATMRAADAAIIVTRPSYLDVRTLPLALDVVAKADRAVLGVVPNGLERRTMHQDEALDELRQRSPLSPPKFSAASPKRNDRADAPTHGRRPHRTERVRPPAPYPAELREERVVSRQALVRLPREQLLRPTRACRRPRRCGAPARRGRDRRHDPHRGGVTGDGRGTASPRTAPAR